MDKFADIEQLLSDLRDLSYETGYIAGKIECNIEQDRSYQLTRIKQRNICYETLLKMIEDLEV